MHPRTTVILQAIAIGALLLITSRAQQINTPGASLNVDAPALAAIGEGPVQAASLTDSVISVNLQGPALMPVLMLAGPLQIGASAFPGSSIDIAVLGSYYPNQVVVDGFSMPHPFRFTNVYGEFSIAGILSSCVPNPVFLAPDCSQPSSTTIAVQAILPDVGQPPYFLRATAAANVVITNGYTAFTLSGEGSATYNFPTGFTFPFYGTTYTRCFVSANGFVSFGTTPDTGFPSPSVSYIRGASPRIMVYYSDLIPENLSTSPRIYAQRFLESGVGRIRIGYENLTEFGATGLHGGDVVLSANGDIDLFLAPYNAINTINIGIGISPGNNIDNGSPPAIGQTAFGRDLTADLAAAPTVVGTNRGAFELFSWSPPTPNDIVAWCALNGAFHYVRTLDANGLPSYTIF